MAVLRGIAAVLLAGVLAGTASAATIQGSGRSERRPLRTRSTHHGQRRQLTNPPGIPPLVNTGQRILAKQQKELRARKFLRQVLQRVNRER